MSPIYNQNGHSVLPLKTLSSLGFPTPIPLLILIYRLISLQGN